MISPLCRAVVAFCLLAAPLKRSALAAEVFKVFTQPMLISSERGTVTSYVVLTDKKRYNFLPPPGWNVNANATEKTVTFQSEDLTTTISLKFIADARKTSETLRSESTRAEIVARYPDAKLQQAFACHTGANEGVAFDLERRVEDRPPVSIRFALVPFEENMVEFTLTTETRKFAKFHWTLGNLLTSFRVEPTTVVK